MSNVSLVVGEIEGQWLVVNEVPRSWIWKHWGLALLSVIPILLVIPWGDVVYAWSLPVFLLGLLASLGLAWAAVRSAPAIYAFWSWLQIGALWFLSVSLLVGNLPNLKDSAKRVHCMSNIKQLCRGMLMYAEDFDQRLPPADAWYPATRSYVGEEFQCPSATAPWSYAMNSRASSLRVAPDPDAPEEVSRGPSEMVLLFEADARLPNASGGPEWLVFRHQGKTNIGFADGHVRSLKQEGVPSLRWER